MYLTRLKFEKKNGRMIISNRKRRNKELISKTKSTLSEMKSLVTTMLKFLEKDEAAAGEISFKLRIESK